MGQGLWSLSIQAKTGKRNIAPLLAAPANPPLQKKTPNGGSSFYSDWNNLLEINRDISWFTPMCLGYCSGVDDLLTSFAVLWWLCVCFLRFKTRLEKSVFYVKGIKFKFLSISYCVARSFLFFYLPSVLLSDWRWWPSVQY